MKSRFLSAVCCLFVLLLLPSCHRNAAVQEGNKSLSSKTSETYSVDSEGSGNVTAPSDENTHPSSVTTTPQTNSSAETRTETTATIPTPSQPETTISAIDPLTDNANSESNLALGGKMAFTDNWIYLMDKTAMDGGSRFSTDFNDVIEFKPENCSSAPCMEIAGGRIYYVASVDSEYRLYSCDTSGNNPKDSGIRMLGDGIGFRISNNSVYYVNSRSVLMKADLSGGNQSAVLDLAPLKYALATSRMTITDDSLFLMLTNDDKNEVDFYRISLKDGSGERIYTMPFQNGSDYLQFCANGQTLIPYNGWLYFHGYNELYKMSCDGKTIATIHVGNRMIDSMLIQDGKLFYMEDGSMYAISLDNDTVKSVAYISLPFQHNGILVHDYTNVRFLGSDTEYIYMTRTQPLNVTEGSQITDSRVLIERIQLDGNNQTTLFSSK